MGVVLSLFVISFVFSIGYLYLLSLSVISFCYLYLLSIFPMSSPSVSYIYNVNFKFICKILICLVVIVTNSVTILEIKQTLVFA